MKRESEELLALGMIGSTSTLGDRIDRLLSRGCGFSPRASLRGVTVSAIMLLVLVGIAAPPPLWAPTAHQQLRPPFEVATIKRAPPFSLEKMQSGQLHVV